MNSINYKKNDLSVEDDFETAYSPYVVNRCVANVQDTIVYAQAISKYSSVMPKKHQYKYYLNALRSKRRFGKWYKAEKDNEDINVIREYYEVSTRVAKEYKSLLTEEQIEKIKEYTFKGGK